MTQYFYAPSITVSVDDTLKDRMDRHPEINWSEVTRPAIKKKTGPVVTLSS